MTEEIFNDMKTLPMIALRGVTVFPSNLINFDVERKNSVRALQEAGKTDRLIFLAAQKDPSIDIPEEKDIYSVGTICRIRQQLHQPGSNLTKVMVEGITRAQAISIHTTGDFYTADLILLQNASERVSDTRKEALIRNCISLYEQYLRLNNGIGPEQMLNLLADPNAAFVSDFLSQNVAFDPVNKQILLEELRPTKRLELLSRLITKENQVLTIEHELESETQEAMNQSQREYYLHEEMKVIQEELGDDTIYDIEEYRQKIQALPVGDEIREKLLKEVSHLAKQPYGSSEGSVIRGYLDTCLEIPWGVKTKENIDLKKAKKVLDGDHYGLEKVKERILEYLAAKKLSPEIKGGLICLVGPPGTGKTSIALSIAKAINRKPIRISLGGIHDEAEIRGHRKTYIGSMPGRIMNGIIQAKSSNPIMIMDEIDKLGSDYHGDPSAALLEVFDAEQNSSFRDHFLEIPFDLSEVFFITTANTTETIPRPLLDRMEIIELPSYTDEEKVQIAKKHLLPKQRKKHGLSTAQLKVPENVLRAVIASYTKESGVRILEREIARLCRKAASQIASGEAGSVSVTVDSLESLLGPAPIKPDERRLSDTVGLVRGLAFTSVGGEVLDAEVAVVNGTGKIELTGNLGNVMKESAQAAITCARARSEALGLQDDFYKTKDIHIHFPDGAIPKDGPSAGITIYTAVVSALTGIPVRHDIAMTGEITLRGHVLAIGGLREKTMGALRAGIKTVICPKENESDIKEIDPLVRSRLNFIYVSTVDEVLSAALTRMPGKVENHSLIPVLPRSAEQASVRQ